MFIRPLEGKNKGTAGFFGWLAGMFGRVDKKCGVGLVKMLTARGGKRESLSVQKTPVHRAGERAVLKGKICKGKENAPAAAQNKSLILAAGTHSDFTLLKV